MTPIEYFRASAVTLAWSVGYEHGVAAMVGVLHTLRNRAERTGEWGVVLAAATLQQGSELVLADTRDANFRRVADIAEQIVTPLDEPCERASSVEGALQWTTQPIEGGIKMGGLYFY